MKTNQPNKDLTDQIKMDLKTAKTETELDALVSLAGSELSDDQLDSAAGGGMCFDLGTYPNCCRGGNSLF